ncbi:MAG: hypothetical protein IKH88_08305 [Prevotella sp.]|nr:hypothetical protein [Prevotella sp.]
MERTFLHYGVRKEDMELISQTCRDCGIDDEWLRENILRPYNDERNKQTVVEQKKLTRIIKKALNNIPL